MADDGSSLPAYSPPGDRTQFPGPFKTLSKEEVDALHLSTLSLDAITIPSIHSGELSPITSTEASFSSDEAEAPTPHSAERSDHPPITPPPLSLGRPVDHLPPPRAVVYASRFSADSDMADMV